jgi:hypothetical protein
MATLGAAERNVILIAGYPRSGTTFTSGVCANAERGYNESIGRFGPHLRGAVRPGHQLDAGFDPEFFARSRAALERVVARTHSRPATVARRFPEVWNAVGRILYVQRHPFDVAISVCKYVIANDRSVPGTGAAAASFEEAVEKGLFARYFERFCALGGAPNFAAGGADAYGTWLQHLAEWHAFLAEGTVPGLVLSYDRLTREPLLRFRLAVRALDLPWREQDIAAALRHMSPEGVRSRLGDHFVSPEPLELRYPELLSPEQVRRGLDSFGEAMLRYGV